MSFAPFAAKTVDGFRLRRCLEWPGYGRITENRRCVSSHLRSSPPGLSALPEPQVLRAWLQPVHEPDVLPGEVRVLAVRSLMNLVPGPALHARRQAVPAY